MRDQTSTRCGRMDLSLPGRVAHVTGGSRGIGKAAALGLAQAGAEVIVASRKLLDLEKAAKEIGKLGRRALAIAAHISKSDERNVLVSKTMDAFGRIDILVNIAGGNPVMDPALEIEARAWDTIMNLKARFFLSQAVARVMKEQGGGNIINVTSVEGIIPSILRAYSISKAGVIMATKIMAREWSQYNIRVNAVAPGLTRTRFGEAL